MTGKLAGKVALVTGSTAGIGRAIAELFAAEGASVMVNGRRETLGEQVAGSIIAAGGSAAFCAADIILSEDIRRLVESTVASFGGLDILVNNAWSGDLGTVLDVDEAQWDRLFAATLKACFLGARAALPHMIARGGGSIINISSVHGILATAEFAPYDVAKAGICQLTRNLAITYGPQGVRSNAICPGLIMTEYAKTYLAEHPAYARQTKGVYPLGRAGQPEEVARAALFLASDDASFITGHSLVVDGGMTVQLQDSLATKLERELYSQ